MPASPTVFTIGHSNHTEVHFLALLKQHSIQAIADVRSAPYSRMNPHFNREFLQRSLSGAGILYVFLGLELGARSSDPSCYQNGQVQFDRLARTSLFLAGLDRISTGITKHRIAILCSEKEPLECHRTILVARALVERNITVHHIHADGSTETHAALIERLASSLPLRSAELHLFRTDEQLLADVYTLQERRIAYRPAEEESNPLAGSV